MHAPAPLRSRGPEAFHPDRNRPRCRIRPVIQRISGVQTLDRLEVATSIPQSLHHHAEFSSASGDSMFARAVATVRIVSSGHDFVCLFFHPPAFVFYLQFVRFEEFLDSCDKGSESTQSCTDDFCKFLAYRVISWRFDKMFCQPLHLLFCSVEERLKVYMLDLTESISAKLMLGNENTAIR